MKNRRNQQSEKISPSPHKWTLIFSVAAIAISIGSLIIASLGYFQTKAINHLYVKPDVMVAVRHNTLPQSTNTPYAAELVVLNKGPIKAASVFVKCSTWIVNTNVWWPEAGVGIQMPLNFDYVFKLPELEVGEGRVKSILGADPVMIFQVELSYYHPNTMEMYSDKELFFYDSGQFYDEAGFKQKPYASILIKNLQDRINGKPGEVIPGKAKPTEAEMQMHPFLFSVPDDKELPRPLE
jgi:hypothetical protein